MVFSYHYTVFSDSKTIFTSIHNSQVWYSNTSLSLKSPFFLLYIHPNFHVQCIFPPHLEKGLPPLETKGFSSLSYLGKWIFQAKFLLVKMLSTCPLTFLLKVNGIHKYDKTLVILIYTVEQTGQSKCPINHEKQIKRVIILSKSLVQK